MLRKVELPGLGRMHMYDMLNLPLVFVGDVVAYMITIISSVLRCMAYLTASVSCVYSLICGMYNLLL